MLTDEVARHINEQRAVINYPFASDLLAILGLSQAMGCLPRLPAT